MLITIHMLISVHIHILIPNAYNLYICLYFIQMRIFYTKYKYCKKYIYYIRIIHCVTILVFHTSLSESLKNSGMKEYYVIFKHINPIVLCRARCSKTTINAFYMHTTLSSIFFT